MKSLFEQMGGAYRKENGCLIPNLSLPDEKQLKIGVWATTFKVYQTTPQGAIHQSADK